MKAITKISQKSFGKFKLHAVNQVADNNQGTKEHILRTVCNKKINPANLSGKDLTAWNLLDKAWQERILHW